MNITHEEYIELQKNIVAIDALALHYLKCGINFTNSGEQRALLERARYLLEPDSVIEFTLVEMSLLGGMKQIQDLIRLHRGIKC